MTDKFLTYKTRFADWLDDELKRKGLREQGSLHQQVVGRLKRPPPESAPRLSPGILL